MFWHSNLLNNLLKFSVAIKSILYHMRTLYKILSPLLDPALELELSSMIRYNSALLNHMGIYVLFQLDQGLRPEFGQKQL